MAKPFKPGIPDNFKFDVAPVADLGDYLDERGPSPVVAKRGRDAESREEPKAVAPAREPSSASVAAPPVVEPVVVANIDVQQPQSRPTPVTESLPVERITEPRAPRHTGPRREINMTPEALRMSDELLELVRSGSGQSDTKANELMHALLLLAYEVKEDLDPYSIPKRGRWGTPTARAYPLEIKNAILRALVRRHAGTTS